MMHPNTLGRDMKFKRTTVIATACLLSATLSVSGVPAVAFAEPTDVLQQRVDVICRKMVG